MNYISSYFYNNTTNQTPLSEKVENNNNVQSVAKELISFDLSAVPQVKNASALVYSGNQELRAQEIREIHMIQKTLTELNQLNDEELNALLGNDFELPTWKKREIIRDSIISTTLAYRNLDDYVRLFGEKPKFEIMVYDETNGKEVKTTYEFEKRVSLDGAVGYVVLKDQAGQKAPLLMFNGTYRYTGVKGQGSTIQADLDRRGIGYTAIEQNMESLDKELKSLSEEGQKKVHCVGHSLGGATSTRVGIHFPQYVKSVAAFESPKMDKYTASIYDKSENGAEINTYNSEYDPVSKFGDNWVGDVFRITPSKENKQSYMDAHEKTVAHKVGTRIEKLNPKEYSYVDNIAWSVQFASPIGGLLYGTGLYARKAVLGKENGLRSYFNGAYSWYTGPEYSDLYKKVTAAAGNLSVAKELDSKDLVDRQWKEIKGLEQQINYAEMPLSYKKYLHDMLPKNQ